MNSQAKSTDTDHRSGRGDIGGIAAEYGMITAFIAGILAIAVIALGGRITGLFDLF